MTKLDSPHPFNWIDYDLVFRHSDKSISDFLKMRSSGKDNNWYYNEPVITKELTEEDLFKNLNDDLKEVCQKIN